MIECCEWIQNRNTIQEAWTFNKVRKSRQITNIYRKHFITKLMSSNCENIEISTPASMCSTDNKNESLDFDKLQCEMFGSPWLVFAIPVCAKCIIISRWMRDYWSTCILTGVIRTMRIVWQSVLLSVVTWPMNATEYLLHRLVDIQRTCSCGVSLCGDKTSLRLEFAHKHTLTLMASFVVRPRAEPYLVSERHWTLFRYWISPSTQTIFYDITQPSRLCLFADSTVESRPTRAIWLWVHLLAAGVVIVASSVLLSPQRFWCCAT